MVWAVDWPPPPPPPPPPGPGILDGVHRMLEGGSRMQGEVHRIFGAEVCVLLAAFWDKRTDLLEKLKFLQLLLGWSPNRSRRTTWSITWISSLEQKNAFSLWLWTIMRDLVRRKLSSLCRVLFLSLDDHRMEVRNLGTLCLVYCVLYITIQCKERGISILKQNKLTLQVLKEGILWNEIFTMGKWKLLYNTMVHDMTKVAFFQQHVWLSCQEDWKYWHWCWFDFRL